MPAHAPTQRCGPRRSLRGPRSRRRYRRRRGAWSRRRPRAAHERSPVVTTVSISARSAARAAVRLKHAARRRRAVRGGRLRLDRLLLRRADPRRRSRRRRPRRRRRGEGVPHEHAVLVDMDKKSGAPRTWSLRNRSTRSRSRGHCSGFSASFARLATDSRYCMTATRFSRVMQAAPR